MPESPPLAIKALVSSGGKQGSVFGKYPQGSRQGAPAISQWPDGVSLPGARSTPKPQSPPGGCGRVRPGGKTPVEASAARPRPRASRWGTCKAPLRRSFRLPSPLAQATVIWPSVSAPASPNWAASSAPPQPRESRMRRSARGKVWAYWFKAAPATALTSNAAAKSARV